LLLRPGAWLLAIQPCWLKALPPVAHHGLSRSVGIGALGELVCEELGGAGRHGFPDPLPVVDNRPCPVCVENSFEFAPGSI
jgi:hypothetical protein